MERIGFLFNDILTYDNLVLAWIKARRGKSGKADARAFGRDLTNNLETLRADLASNSFRFGAYKYFTIQDPKERLICAASFPERVAHHAIMNILDPIFEKHQIYDSYACRRGKGTRAALLRAFDSARRRKYFLKMDARKYFDSIDHETLKLMLRCLFKDERVIATLDGIIDSYSTAEGKGLPIGNLTSQYFANHYLSLLDHYAKDRLGVRSWIRYMDDILVLADDKSGLLTIYEQSRVFCADKVRLTLKPAIIDATARGAPFLGFLVKPGGIYLAARSKRRYAAKSGKILHDLQRGYISMAKAGDRAVAMAAHTLVARAHAFRYLVHHGRGLGNEPCESRRELEQQRVERTFGQPQQQHSKQPEQQYWLPFASFL